MIEEFQRAIEQLLGRLTGPMFFRIVLQPLASFLLAIRSGIRDARADKPAFLWHVMTNSAERKNLLISAWKDIGRVIIFAFLMDAIYQLIVFKTFWLLQTIIVVVVLAVLPYILLRGPVRRILRRRFQKTKDDNVTR